MKAARPNIALLWLTGAVIIAGLALVEWPWGDDDSLHITGAIIVHAHYMLSLANACALFAIVYFVLDRVVRLAYRRPLAWAHLWLSLVGALLIYLPGVGLHLIGARNLAVDPRSLMTAVSGVASVGYLMTLSGLLVFAILLIGAIHARLAKRMPV